MFYVFQHSASKMSVVHLAAQYSILQINKFKYYVTRSWGSSVSIVSDCGLDDWGLIPIRDMGFLVFP
jgi:hypothetical protein